jgi:integrase
MRLISLIKLPRPSQKYLSFFGRPILPVARAMSRVCEKLDVVNGTAHDLRGTGASMMAFERCGVRSEVIARILNHTPLGSPVTQIYNRYD